jgi:hypothetical protein
MDAIDSGSWGPGDIIYTEGLSVCSVLAVFDENKWIMSHVPPARIENGKITSTLDLINEYTKVTKSKISGMKNPEGYLLISKNMETKEQDAPRKFIKDNKISVREKIYEYGKDVKADKGIFKISREGKDGWPPAFSLE